MRINSTVVAVLWLGACGSTDSSPDAATDIAPGEVNGLCPADELLGAIVANLDEGFTSVQGKIGSATPPLTQREVVASEGECRLLKPPTLFCSPVCLGELTCSTAGDCVPAAIGISVGPISVTGLTDPVEMTARAPVYFYTHTGTLGHPGFTEGALIHLAAGGQDVVEPFGLDVIGVQALMVMGTSVTLEENVPVVLTWQGASDPSASQIHVELNIAQHGGTPGSIECDVLDTGEFTLPQNLTNQLLAAGFSGFPSLGLTRRSVDSTTIDTISGQRGCVEFRAQSKVTLPVEIDGLRSCSTIDDCLGDQVCGPDLSCQDP